MTPGPHPHAVAGVNAHTMPLYSVLTIWSCLQGLAMQFFRLMYPHIGSLIGLFRLCGYCSESARHPPGLLLGMSDVQDSQCLYRLPCTTCWRMGDLLVPEAYIVKGRQVSLA